MRSILLYSKNFFPVFQKLGRAVEDNQTTVFLGLCDTHIKNVGGVWSTIVQNNACALLSRILSGDIIYTECINYYHNDNLYIGLYLHTFWLYFKVCHRYICCYLNGQSRSTYGEGAVGWQGGNSPPKGFKKENVRKKMVFSCSYKNWGFFWSFFSYLRVINIQKYILQPYVCDPLIGQSKCYDPYHPGVKMLKKYVTPIHIIQKNFVFLFHLKMFSKFVIMQVSPNYQCRPYVCDPPILCDTILWSPAFSWPLIWKKMVAILSNQ